MQSYIPRRRNSWTVLTIDSIDMTIMHEGSCRRSWAVRGLELRYVCSKIILGVNSKRNIIYSRSCSVNLLIASYSICWSIDADLGSFGSFGLALQKSVHHSGQTKVCLEHPADTAVVPCTLDRSLEKRG